MGLFWVILCYEFCYHLKGDNFKNIDLSKVNNSLSVSLNKRVDKEKKEIYPLWRRGPLSIRAASVLLFLGVGSYLLINRNEDNSVEKLASIPSSKEEKIANCFCSAVYRR